MEQVLDCYQVNLLMLILFLKIKQKFQMKEKNGQISLAKHEMRELQ